MFKLKLYIVTPILLPDQPHSSRTLYTHRLPFHTMACIVWAQWLLKEVTPEKSAKCNRLYYNGSYMGVPYPHPGFICLWGCSLSTIQSCPHPGCSSLILTLALVESITELEYSRASWWSSPSWLSTQLLLFLQIPASPCSLPT